MGRYSQVQAPEPDRVRLDEEADDRSGAHARGQNPRHHQRRRLDHREATESEFEVLAVYVGLSRRLCKIGPAHTPHRLEADE